MRRKWGLEDLIECWTLDEEERALLANKTGATRLGFAVILRFFEQEARFPRREDITRAAGELMAGRMWIGNSALVTAPWHSVGPSSTPAKMSPVTAGWPSRRRRIPAARDDDDHGEREQHLRVRTEVHRQTPQEAFTSFG